MTLSKCQMVLVRRNFRACGWFICGEVPGIQKELTPLPCQSISGSSILRIHIPVEHKLSQMFELNLCSPLQLAISVCMYCTGTTKRVYGFKSVSSSRLTGKHTREWQTQDISASKSLNISKKLYSKFQLYQSFATGAINSFQSFPDYCCIGYAMLRWSTSLCKGWQPWLLQIINVAYLVELTPDSFGLSFLIYILLCFIPGSRLPETSAATITRLQCCLLYSHWQTKEEMGPK